MGWASGGEVFDPVATKLIELGASDEVKQQVCSVLIKALQDRGWDTEGESLGEFEHDPAIVAAFREHDILRACWSQNIDHGWTCEEEFGHDGDHDDHYGHRWP